MKYVFRLVLHRPLLLLLRHLQLVVHLPAPSLSPLEVRVALEVSLQVATVISAVRPRLVPWTSLVQIRLQGYGVDSYRVCP